MIGVDRKEIVEIFEVEMTEGVQDQETGQQRATGGMALLVVEIHGVDDISEEPLEEEEMTQEILEGMTEEITDVMIDVTREEMIGVTIGEMSDEMIGEMMLADGLVPQEDEKKIRLDSEEEMRMIEINENEMNQGQERLIKDKGPDQGLLENLTVGIGGRVLDLVHHTDTVK